MSKWLILFVMVFGSHAGVAEEEIAQEASEKNGAFEIEFDNSEVLKGQAFWQKNNKLAYLEQHTIYYKDGKRVKVETEYRYPNGEKFADFNSDYTKHPYIPAYRFEDTRFKREEGVEWINPKTIRIFGKKFADSKMKSKKVDVPKVGFAGQGFNFYVVDHLEKIVKSKKPVEVDFIIPLEQKSFPFRIKSKGPVKGNIAKFRAEIDNWLFRLFAPSIDVKYDLEKKILLEYKGPSNLLNKKKDVEAVVIKYDTSGISVKQATNNEAKEEFVENGNDRKQASIEGTSH